MKWRTREDLVAEVAEVGDTVYVKPLVHVLQHNRVPLVRVQEFLGLSADKVTVLHFDLELPVGQYTSAFGGRSKNNVALKIAADSLKEDGFGRFGLGVADPQGSDFQHLFAQGFRGVERQHLARYFLANRLRDEHFAAMRSSMLERLARDLTGSTRAGSIFDTAQRI